MGWLRLDDGFAMHPKVAALSDRDYRAWTKVLLYCARYRTEGDVPDFAFAEIGISPKTRQVFVAGGLLDVDEDGLYSVHDWGDFNKSDPTNAERQRRWRERQKERKRNASNTVTVTPPSVTETVTRNAPSLARALARGRDTVPSTSTTAAEEQKLEGPAAALADQEAPRESRVREVVEALPGADSGSLAQVLPLAMQVDAIGFEQVVERIGQRREVENPVGLLRWMLANEAGQRVREAVRDRGGSGGAYIVPDPPPDLKGFVRDFATRWNDDDFEQAFATWGVDEDERIRLADLAADLRRERRIYRSATC